jgi:hypothetical protein
MPPPWCHRHCVTKSPASPFALLAGFRRVGLLGSLTFVAFVTACQAVTGLPGTGLAALAGHDTGTAAARTPAGSGSHSGGQRRPRRLAALRRVGADPVADVRIDS